MGLTVSLGDGRSSDPDFALGRSVGREVPGLCEIDELDLARRDGDTNGSVLEELGSEDRRESANHRQWEDGGWWMEEGGTYAEVSVIPNLHRLVNVCTKEGKAGLTQ